MGDDYRMPVSLTATLKRHRLIAFLVLAFGLSWLGWPLYLSGLFPAPTITLGVSLAAVVVATLAGGRAELWELLGRLLRWRVGAQWYAVALLLPAVLTGATVYLTRLLGISGDAQIGPWYGILVAVVFQTLFPLAGAVGEELGWRGYALPRLQTSNSALTASLILGTIWAAWHLPLYAAGVWTQPIPHSLSIVAMAIMYTWLFNRTGGSVLLAMLFHGALNGVAEFLYPAIGAPNLELFWWLFAGVSGGVAAGIVFLAGSNLGAARPAAPRVVREPIVGA